MLLLRLENIFSSNSQNDSKVAELGMQLKPSLIRNAKHWQSGKSENG